MLKWLDNLANRQRLFRRTVLAWACGLITWVIYKTWVATPDISSGTATALGIVVGILATVIGFYFQHRKDGDK
jgi:uncharacterized membrane protein (DUF485 family)